MIIDEIMSINGYTDPYFQAAIKSWCDAALSECNALGLPTTADSAEFEFEELIPEFEPRSLVRSYVATFVRLNFDPPQNTKQVELMEKSLTRLGVRIRDYYAAKRV